MSKGLDEFAPHFWCLLGTLSILLDPLPLCSNPWHIQHDSKLFNILRSQMKSRLHFTQWLLMIFMQRHLCHKFPCISSFNHGGRFQNSLISQTSKVRIMWTEFSNSMASFRETLTPLKHICRSFCCIFLGAKTSYGFPFCSWNPSWVWSCWYPNTYEATFHLFLSLIPIFKLYF